MAGVNQVFSLADDVARYLRACGKRSILEIKPPKNNDLIGLKIAEDSIFDTCEFSYYIRHFGRQVDIKPLKRTDYNTIKSLLALPKEMAGGIGDFPSCDASTYMMDITSKMRRLSLAKTNPKIAERLRLHPELIKLTEEEAVSLKVIEDAFKKIKPNIVDTIEYRGCTLSTKSPFYKQIFELKIGDVYTEPGYIWTSADPHYAHGRYAAKTLLTNASIRYHILLPKGTKMLCADRVNTETLLKGDFKVTDIIKDGDDIELFVEHIPFV